jgi:orotate phosphoribosyltransferase
MTRTELAKRISEVSLLHGDFTLRSGRKSKYYLDKYRFETQPAILLELGKLFAAHVSADVHRIAGPELGAVPLAAAAAMASGTPAIFIRNHKKEYGSNKQIEGIYVPGETVLLIEDIMTTGGQVVEAARTLEAAGLKIKKIVGVIDRLEGARENIETAGYQFESLFTTKDLGIA